VLFLGYPNNSHFGPSPSTGKTETYGDMDGSHGGKLDYHTVRHGKPAPYSLGTLTADLAEIVRDYTPTDVYLPVSSDMHSDHRLTHQAMEAAIKASGLKIQRHYWILHAREGDAQWPTPPCVTTCKSYSGSSPPNPEERFTPGQDFPPPQGYPPFDELVPAVPDKRALVATYQTQMDYGPYGQGYLLACIKKTEGFWKRDISMTELRLRRAWLRLWRRLRRA
jgi:LmbE family N-acetylglucosaminyl deacetylase